MLTYGYILNVVIQNLYCRPISMAGFQFLEIQLQFRALCFIFLIVQCIFYTVVGNDILMCEVLLLLCNCTTVMLQHVWSMCPYRPQASMFTQIF